MSNQNNLIVGSLALGGYRSFGGEIQRFVRFRKINLFIGQNNSGKSNILRFMHEHFPTLHTDKAQKREPLDQHMPSGAAFTVGLSYSLNVDANGEYQVFKEKILPLFAEQNKRTHLPGYILTVFENVAKQSSACEVWFDFNLQNGKPELVIDQWINAFKKYLKDNEIHELWHRLTNSNGGSRDAHWIPESIIKISPKFPAINTAMVPAIRQISELGDNQKNDFGGKGLIDHLVKLQNPNVFNRKDIAKFEKINEFLQSVTDNDSARIEIPHERDTILVHMDGKTLPLNSLGTGIHEVIILASASTILDNTLICMEEPEIHLNPLLQKKLVRYLEEKTTNQYFIATHSAALIDSQNAEIYHVRYEKGQSRIERVTSDRHRSAVCEDLGYRPSDLLQANCIIWVEGPSDRIYINHWIKFKRSDYIEGTHYSIMFYGGRLSAHLSGDDPGETIDSFISLRRLNRRGVIVIDSDRDRKGKRINDTKSRLKEEFDKGPGYAWITDGREIENYISLEQIAKAVEVLKPGAIIRREADKYYNLLSIETRKGKISQAPKVEVAKYITNNNDADFKVLDLDMQINKLIDFIDKSNAIV